jgi:alanine racemase
MKNSVHRPTRAIINLDNIRFNIQSLKEHLPRDTEVFAVVKANAYGHGAVRVSLAVNDLVSGFCVSNLDEALELREAGIKKPILILSGIEPCDVSLAIKENLSITLPSLDYLEEILKEDVDLEGLKVHIAVDSGMGRIGLRDAEELRQIIARLAEFDLEAEGIFTHFATADEKATDKFLEQQDNFQALIDSLEKRPKYVHSSNSATGIWRDNLTNIVRFGAGMYGLNPSGRTLSLPYPLKGALTLESHVTHAKRLPAGQTVGYGATFVADKDTFIVTVPMGYADGWTRDMQGSNVIIEGKLYPIVGRVSMDQITIEVDKLYPLGTTVTFIGQNGQETITIDDVADKRKTINYEVACLLSDRISREYTEMDIVVE